MDRPIGVTFASLQALGPIACLELAKEAEGLGYTSAWNAEVNGVEAFGFLGSLGASTSGMGLGTGVLALQLRTPPLLAMAAATLQAIHPDRDIWVGVGISSPVVAGRWHGVPYGPRPLAKTREFLTLLRRCLSGDKVDFEGEFYTVKGFKLGVRLGDRRPQIVLGALNERMLQLGGELADGVLLNYLPATHVPWSVEQVRRGGEARIHAYIHAGVCAWEGGVEAARYDLFSYAVVDSYARNFERAGFGPEVEAIRAAHAQRDRAGALLAVSDDMIDAIDFMGDAAGVSSRVRAYVDAGVDHPILFPLPWGPDRLAVAAATLAAAIA